MRPHNQQGLPVPPRTVYIYIFRTSHFPVGPPQPEGVVGVSTMDPPTSWIVHMGDEDGVHWWAVPHCFKLLNFTKRWWLMLFRRWMDYSRLCPMAWLVGRRPRPAALEADADWDFLVNYVRFGRYSIPACTHRAQAQVGAGCM